MFQVPKERKEFKFERNSSLRKYSSPKEKEKSKLVKVQKEMKL